MFCISLESNHYDFIKELGYIPVGLGEKHFSNDWFSDKSGTNISEKNKYYGEYTYHYWIWKNYLEKLDDGWIGFCQYRKFWSLEEHKNEDINFNNLNSKILKEIPKECDNYETILGTPFFINQFKGMKFIKNGLKIFIKNPFLFFNKKKRNINFHFDLMHGENNLNKAINLLDAKNKEDFRKFDENNKILFLSEMLTYSARNFHLAYQVAYFDAHEIINRIIEDNKIYSEEVISLLKISLFNYFAAALLMPYDEFLQSAKKNKYDVEILMHHFATSFEQVTHRLTNLQRPGNEGVPFHFLKTDIAGNVSKRFSLSGIHIPRHGGSCPRWNVYIAFLNPGRIHPQISKMPDGRTYFCIARAFEKGVEKHGMPKSFVSIGLGCDIQYAKELTYSEGMDLQNKKLETPIGVSCRICPREDCQQRAFPPIDKELKLDISYRGTSPYVTI